MTAAKIRALVVDDSALMRAMIPSLLQKSPEIEVVGTAANPILARQSIKDLNPDVITLDVEMPKMDGLSFLEKIMTLRPTPVVMVSSLTQAGANATLRALELGAVDFVAKPLVDIEKNLEGLAGELIDKVKTAARAQIRAIPKNRPVKRAEPISFEATETIVAMGASTGGVETLGRIIEALPANAPGIVIAQHMPKAFTHSFAERLNNRSQVSVAEAEAGRRILPGHVFIAPGDFHLKVKRSGADYICKLDDGPLVCGHKPSVDVLFSSVAKACGDGSIGVILTGMGKDGAAGLLEMREAGAATYAQDEATSLVWGMPKAAYEAGAVERLLPEIKVVPTVLGRSFDRSKAVRI